MVLTEGVMKAMLLSKLKITVCAAALMLAAGVGATGLTYRATAEQPALTSRSQSDDLEALRLEIEALHKSLQATRERVKTLEGEVSALKGKSGGPAGGRGIGGSSGGLPGQRIGGGLGGSAGQGMGSSSGGPAVHRIGGLGEPSGQGKGGVKANNKAGSGAGGRTIGSDEFGLRWTIRRSTTLLDKTTDPVSDAEAALKKLRSNPGDKQATEELERALKRLKEREKQDVPGQVKPGETKGN
jgi:hypothetical protein